MSSDRLRSSGGRKALHDVLCAFGNERAQDVLYELLGDIKAREAAASEAHVARLLAQLSDIREMEQIRLGSAF